MNGANFAARQWVFKVMQALAANAATTANHIALLKIPNLDDECVEVAWEQK